MKKRLLKNTHSIPVLVHCCYYISLLPGCTKLLFFFQIHHNINLQLTFPTFSSKYITVSSFLQPIAATLSFFGGLKFLFWVTRIQTYTLIPLVHHWIYLNFHLYYLLLCMYRVFFFTGPPPKKLKYGKLRLGEVRCI